MVNCRSGGRLRRRRSRFLLRRLGYWNRGKRMVELGSMSREELEQLMARVEAELARRTQVWEAEGTRAWAARELGRLAAGIGPIGASPVPEGGFMPGQIVETNNELYINASGAWVD